jgi:Ca2+-dependent lipid-binding protein
MVLESPRGDKKKGDLAITVIAARNLRSDGKLESAYCVVELSDNKPVRTQIFKEKKEPVWNETFNLDLFSLDTAEVLVSVYAKRRITSDKFLGQMQVPIKVGSKL